MKLTIDFTKPIKDISPILYGIFFEDINRAADGGLYAQLVANGSFDCPPDEYGRDMRLSCWEATGDASVSVKRRRTAVNPNYLHISSLNDGGIINSGFGNDGFGVRSGEEFTISFRARAALNTAVSFRLTEDGAPFAEASVLITGDGKWSKYTAKIKSLSAKKHARLEIRLPMGGESDIDAVSMFPADTFKHRKNGLRKDIAKLIRDMKPKFMRFPGGCVVEGRSIGSMYNWKKSIGAPEMRVPNVNRWGMNEYQYRGNDNRDYYQSLGLGFYEYFLFCEDIGAEPVPVVNCGMTCQWHEGLLVPLDELDPWIQDVLDLIEFANGPVSSEWGQKRAKMGHPAPFGLKYIGIGNEQWGTQYFERYERFYEVIEREYPEIDLITSAGWNSEGPDFDTAVEWIRNNREKAYAVDEHFYKSPEWFMENIHRYDDYDRTMPKVFAGEYACHTSRSIAERRNNWNAALCEAAFLTGVERNADHVIMACYAPLLAKQGFDQWKPDLIWFDNTGVYGTPSYYVQKEFSRNYGTRLIESSCDASGVYASATMDDDAVYIKIVNTNADAKAIELETPGTKLASRFSEIIVMTAELDAENSMEHPARVSPMRMNAEIGTGARISLPPYSVIIVKYVQNIL